MVQNKHRLNIESDGVKVKPLVTVKCNWGEYPDSEGYEIVNHVYIFPYKRYQV